MINTVSGLNPLSLMDTDKAGQTAREQQMSKDEKQLREACQGFEAMFLQMMYKEMRNTVPENDLFGESNGQKIWQSMLDTQLMDNAAKSGGVGLAEMMYKQLAPSVLGEGMRPHTSR